LSPRFDEHEYEETDIDFLENFREEKQATKILQEIKQLLAQKECPYYPQEANSFSRKDD